MKKFDFKFENDFGLHARPAGVLVKKAGEFESNITAVKEDGNRASAKGLFALLGLKIEGGDTVTVEAEGPDEAEAIDAIKALFENNFKNPEISSADLGNGTVVSDVDNEGQNDNAGSSDVDAENANGSAVDLVE